MIISIQPRAKAYDEAHVPQSHHIQIFVMLLTEDERRGDMQGEKTQVSPVASRGFESPLPHSPLFSSSSVIATELGAGRGLWKEGST